MPSEQILRVGTIKESSLFCCLHKKEITMEIEKGKFYFIKDEYFELIKDKELCKNKERGTKRPCFYCFKDKTNSKLIWFIPISSKIEKIYNRKLKKNGIVDTIVFGYVEGEKKSFSYTEYVSYNRRIYNREVYKE